MTKHDKKLAAGVQKWWLKNIVGVVFIGATLFLASGKPNWGIAWVYLCSIFAVIIANAIAMDPSLLVERSELQEGTKKWNVVLASFVAIWGPLSIWLIAGLDIRFGWTQTTMPGLQVVAFIFFVLGSLIGTWAMASNRFFSATVRIQKDRNHQVVTTGPYRYVRHPGYVGGIIAMLMTPLALGSWVALIPSFVVASGFVLRTSLEDKVLQEELGGYKDYAKNIRYRLFPMIW